MAVAFTYCIFRSDAKVAWHTDGDLTIMLNTEKKMTKNFERR